MTAGIQTAKKDLRKRMRDVLRGISADSIGNQCWHHYPLAEMAAVANDVQLERLRADFSLFLNIRGPKE